MTNSKNGTLLYRGTRDGFTAKSFHEKCDGKENTITIIKTDAINSPSLKILGIINSF
jgi:hypothetical protein